MTETDKISIASYCLAFLALVFILVLGLLPAFLAGFLVYHIVEFGSRMLSRGGIIPMAGKIILLALVALVLISGFAILIVGTFSRVTNGSESIVALFQKMADAVDQGLIYLPLWAQEYMPSNLDEWQMAASKWLRSNASNFSKAGLDVGIFLVHLIIGMVIGGIVALHSRPRGKQAVLTQALYERLEFIALSFRQIVFSQIRISALNTFLTAIFIMGFLPLTGNPLPLAKTMIAVTFIAGLLPIIGNLISNTTIFLIGLSAAPVVAVYTLIYLMVIHKLEYFINARIIGTRIKASAWELLIAMLVMEAAFGIAGLVAAPVYYAYLKNELAAKKLV